MITGKELKALREKAGLSQPQLAERLGSGGYTRHMISEIENNRRNIGIKLLSSWAEGCGYTVRIEFDRKEEQP